MGPVSEPGHFGSSWLDFTHGGAVVGFDRRGCPHGSCVWSVGDFGDDALDHFRVSEEVWSAFESQVGSPGTDIRLLAALPRSGCGNAATRDGGLTALQATQAGLVWRLARRSMAAQSGVSEESFIDVDPWIESGEAESGDTGARGQEPRPRTGP